MIVEEIRTLLEAPTAGPGAPTLDALEHTLTAGYARALTLEAERKRLERKISWTAEVLGHGGPDALSGELAKLGRRLSRVDLELTRLRSLLATLRDRASDVRAA